MYLNIRRKVRILSSIGIKIRLLIKFCIWKGKLWFGRKKRKEIRNVCSSGIWGCKVSGFKLGKYCWKNGNVYEIVFKSW